jgi:predicted metal-dependent peptidase
MTFFWGGKVFLYCIFLCACKEVYIARTHYTRLYYNLPRYLAQKNKDTITTILQSHMIYHLFRLFA